MAPDNAETRPGQRTGGDGRGPRNDKGHSDGRRGRDGPRDPRPDRDSGDRQGDGRLRERREWHGDGDRPSRDDRGRRGDRPGDDHRRYDGPKRRYGDRDARRDRSGRSDRRDRPRDRGDAPKARDAGSEPPSQAGGGHDQEQVLTIPSTPQKILFKGVDCEVNGRKDLAMVLYLHGAARLSGGCESNMLRILREAGPGQFSTIRGRVAKQCSEDAMLAFDYLCCQIREDSDRTAIREAAGSGNPFAIHCLIRLDDLSADDSLITTYARSGADEAMLREGLKRLVRKKDSAPAQACLDELDRLAKLRQTVRVEFVRSMKGDAQAMDRLQALSDTFPEAGFLRGYVDAEDREAYIREGMGVHRSTIMSVVSELGISDTPYGRYLAAKRAQAEGDEWVQGMINAAVAGSDDAIGELMPLKNRKDVRKAMSMAFLAHGDVEGLVRSYDGEDTTYLDKYASSDPARMIEVGRAMGGSREVEWLRHCAIGGSTECRDELVAISSSAERRGKQMIYALHDVGADLDAAKLYFDMYGDPALPAVKWLRKVCEDEAAKEYVRSRFEGMGDTATFDSIFVDDGYRSKGGKGSRPRDRRR